MKKENTEKKIEIEAGICPKCGGHKLDYFDSEPIDNMRKYPYTCADCGFEGIEWYNVIFSCHWDTDGNEL